MTDFTKEELQLLLIVLDNAMDKYLDENKHMPLYTKIDSKIKNYCDHEWENICCHCALGNLVCYKCNKDFEGNEID